MFDYHSDRRKYFDILVSSTEKYVIPFIERRIPVRPGMRVLEVGCGEGGVLKSFLDRGCVCVGIDTDPNRVDNGRRWLDEDVRENRLRFVVKDIYQAAGEIREAVEEMHPPGIRETSLASAGRSGETAGVTARVVEMSAETYGVSAGNDKKAAEIYEHPAVKSAPYTYTPYPAKHYTRTLSDALSNSLSYSGTAQSGTALFDIIILKDTIEHIPEQSKLIALLKTYLCRGGVIFFGFPPWQMPFGGHQQMCRNKWLSVLPYYHLLPVRLYRSILRRFREPVEDLLDIRGTRLSIEDFERITRSNGYTIVGRQHYLLNPIYEWKFGWKPRTQLPLIRDIPFLRNFVTSCAYYLVTS
ncbi:MAG: class I SAM-dependent methyltransferase [Puia sp.]|nr:class I SAM-dependent methyltransferase [Puia sp.]